MYDAVRLDWVKVKITPTTSVLLKDQKQAIFVSAWDRNGLTNPSVPPNFAEICSYSSSFQRAINLQATAWSATRKIFASSIAEKSFFIPTSVVQTLSGKMATTGLNISPGQSLSIPWNPQLLLGVLLSASTYTGFSFQYPTAANAQTWNFICEFEWGLTFKGLRYDKPDGGAPITSAASKANPRAQTALGVNDPNPADGINAMSESIEEPPYDEVEGQVAILSCFFQKTSSSQKQQLYWKRNFPWQKYRTVENKLTIIRTGVLGAFFAILEVSQGSLAIGIVYVPADATLNYPSSLPEVHVSYLLDAVPITAASGLRMVVNYAVGGADPVAVTLNVSDPRQYNVSTNTVFNVDSVVVPFTDADNNTTLIPLTSHTSLPTVNTGTVPDYVTFPYHYN